MRKFAITSACLVCSAGPALAQGDFGRLKAKVGQHLVVTEDGLSVSGTLTALAPDVLTIDGRDIRPAPNLVIERELGNPIARGLLGGIGVAGIAGLLLTGGNPGGGLMLLPAGALWGAVAGSGGRDRALLYDSRSFGPAPPQIQLPAAAAAPASVDFSHTRLKLGTPVFVTDRGVTVWGDVTALEPTRLVVGAHTFGPRQDLRVQRRGDSVWDGFGAGFLLGAVAGPTVGAEGCLHEPAWRCAASSGLTLGVIGALLDWRHKGRTVVYDTTR